MGEKKKYKRVSTRIVGVRKIDRAVAKAAMKKQGMTRINRSFSSNWRAYA